MEPNPTKTNPPATKSGSLFYFGWYIAIAGMLIQALGYGSRYSFSVFFPTLLDYFGWHRDVGASVLSVHLLCYGLMAPLAGNLVDRFGTRRTMMAGTAVLSLGLLLSRWGYQPWHFYFTFGVMAGAGLCLLGSVPLTMIVRNWFERKKALALSLVFCGSGGAYACYPAVAWLIASYGWQDAYAILGLSLALIFVPTILLIMHYSPQAKGLKKDGTADPTPNKAGRLKGTSRVVDQAWASRHWTLGQAAKTSRFWFMCLTTFSAWGVGQHILVTHQVAFALDMGYERLYASAVLSLGGWTFCIGALLSMISDRIGREPTMAIAMGCCFSAVCVLLMVSDNTQPWMLYYFAIVGGLGFGMSAPLVPASVTDLFQGPKVGATVGFIWFSFSMGGTVGPWLGGWLFEISGNYTLAFLIAALFLLLAAVSIWLAAPRKVRLVPGKSLA
jgi:MFS family permease